MVTTTFRDRARFRDPLQPGSSVRAPLPPFSETLGTRVEHEPAGANLLSSVDESHQERWKQRLDFGSCPDISRFIRKQETLG